MRKLLAHASLVLLAVAGLAGCTPDGTSTAPSPTDAATGPTPAPSSAAPLPSGPGQGNAELVIIIKSSGTETTARYTLVCKNGAPAAESEHPNPAAACSALKNNPAILSPAPRPTDRLCTQEYGGSQEATITGVVDGRSVEVSFSRRNGCEIASWNAAKAVLGTSGGAA